MPITRTPIVDDDGSGTSGTVLDNAWKTELYNQIDGADAAIAPITKIIGHTQGSTNNPAEEDWFSGFIGTQYAGDIALWDEIAVDVDLHYGGAIPYVTLWFLQGNIVNLVDLLSLGNGTKNGFISTSVRLRRHATVDNYLHMWASGGGPAAATTATGYAIDGWIAHNMAISMRHGGVPAGGFLNWRIIVRQLIVK